MMVLSNKKNSIYVVYFIFYFFFFLFYRCSNNCKGFCKKKKTIYYSYIILLYFILFHFFTDPEYPSTSVYVTAIGATKFIDAIPGPEMAVVNFKSGSGFSDLFPQPDYQAQFVQSYLNSGVDLPPQDAFNSSNR